MINTKPVILAGGVSTAILYVLCVLFGLFISTGGHELFEAVLPGFTWLTPGSFFLGLVWTLFYGALVGLVFSLVYNAFARLWPAAPVLAVR